MTEYKYTPQSSYNFEPYECALIIQWGGFLSKNVHRLVLPCYAESVNESVNANYQSTNIVGRAGQIHAYSSTNDPAVQFSFRMHREMVNPQSPEDDLYIDSVVRALKSTCYPMYSGGSTLPPRTTFKFGDTVISGVVNSVSHSWQPPIVNKAYTVCEVTVSMLSVPTFVPDKSNVLGTTASSSLTVRGSAPASIASSIPTSF